LSLRLCGFLVKSEGRKGAKVGNHRIHQNQEFAMHPDTSRSFVAREQEELTEKQAGQ